MRKLASLISLFISLSSLTSCDKDKFFKKEKLLDTYMVVSDLHLLSNNLVPNNDLKKVASSDGRIQEKDYELVDLLVEEVNKRKPSYLFITGDLTYMGEKDSHLELVKLLNKINDQTQVLVIPGNHDCYNTSAKDYSKTPYVETESIDYNEFKTIYNCYGYKEALSYDSISNSYIYDLGNDRWAFMISTPLSEYNYSENMNLVGGAIFEETYNWMSDWLEKSKNQNKKVISFMHHNLAIHNTSFMYGYRITSYQYILDLYNEYNVKVNFSGHLHIQSIKEVQNVYDIASGSLLDYGNRFGVIDIYSNCIEYHTEKLSAKDYDLNKYSFNTFYDKYYNKSKLNEEVYGDKLDDVKDLVSKANCYYFDGDYESIDKLIRSNRNIYKLLKNNNNNNYIKTIFENNGESQNYLLVKQN